MCNKPKRYTQREFEQLLKRNGYKVHRNCGSSHTIYMNETGDKITVNARINEMVALRLIKEHNLKEKRR